MLPNRVSLPQSGVLAPEPKEALEMLYRFLNPIRLREQVNRQLERLWAMAEHLQGKEAAVTQIMRQPLPVR